MYICLYRYVEHTKTFIMHIGIRKTREIGSGTKLFITFLSLRFFHMRRERHNFFLCWLFHLTPSRAAPPPKTTGLASASSENRLASSKPKSQLSRSEFKSQLTVFFCQIPKTSALLGMTSFTSPVSFPICFFLLWHLWLSHSPRTRVNTCTQCMHLTNPCTKPKGSQIN